MSKSREVRLSHREPAMVLMTVMLSLILGSCKTTSTLTITNWAHRGPGTYTDTPWVGHIYRNHFRIDVICAGSVAPQELTFATFSSDTPAGETQTITVEREWGKTTTCTVRALIDDTQYTGYWQNQFSNDGEPYFTDTMGGCVPGQGRGHWQFSQQTPPTFTPASTGNWFETTIVVPTQSTVKVEQVAVCD